jgi:hypothetical protein
MWAEALRLTGAAALRRIAVLKSPLVWHLLALAALSTYVFTLRRDVLFWHLDGIELRQLIETKYHWSKATTSAALDPYRGPGNLSIPGNFRLLPIIGLQQFFRDGNVGHVITYVAYNCQNLLLLSLLARRLKLASSVGIVAGWLLAVLVTPLVWTDRTTLVFPMFPMAPVMFELVTFVVLFFVAFVEIGRFDGVASSLLILACVSLSLWFVAASPISVLLLVPYVGVLIVTSMLSGTRRERVWKLSGLVILFATLWCAGALVYPYGFLKASPVSFFGSEIATYQSGLWWSSIAYQYDRFPAGTIVVVASLAAGLVTLSRTVFSAQNIQLFRAAVVHSVLAAGLLLEWPIVQHVPALRDRLRHVRMFYFEVALLPFYVLFAAVAVIAVAKWIRVYPVKWPLGMEQAVVPALVSLVVLPATRSLQASNPYREPVEPTVITEYLQANTGLQPGWRFRGRVVSVFQPASGRETTSWDAMIATDSAVYNAAHNDLRFVGLWEFGIPTLQEYSQIIGPGTYFWITRAMSTSADRQDMRNHALITRVDVALLELWGTRFVLSPTPLTDSASLRLVVRDGDHWLYELPGANVGQYFASTAVPVRDFSEMFQNVHGTSDLLTRTFVFGSVPSELFPGSVDIQLDRNAISVTGKSQDTSLVVLPFTYSHCYSVSKAAESRGVQLIRVNLNMLGLLFRNEVHDRFEMSTGLFNRPDCVLMDTRDYERLGLSRLADAIPRGRMIDGQADTDLVSRPTTSARP